MVIISNSMEGKYRLTNELYRNGVVSVSKGVKCSDGTPVVVKKHDLNTFDPEFIKKLTHVVNEGISQARVEHQHICKIIEISFTEDRSENLFTVHHILEAAKGDLEKNITERQENGQLFSETELWTFLLQVSSALAYTHSKVAFTQGIAHRDIKPGNILLDDQGNYKLTDFDCFFLKKTSEEEELTGTALGTKGYMSPEQRNAWTVGSLYDPFKADVYCLGLTVVNMALLSLLKLDEARDILETIRGFNYSRKLKNLMLAMVETQESVRPDMQTVYNQASAELKKPTISDTRLVSLTAESIEVFDIPKKSHYERLLDKPIVVDQTSRWIWMESSLFCSGGTTQEQAQRNAYEVQPEGTVTQLPDMITPRSCHGLWWDSHRHQLDVFGGTAYLGEGSVETDFSALRDCEQLSRQTESWRNLPSMQDARSDFTPCEYQKLVYLCGKGTLSIEAFNPEACSFRSFQAQQPEMYSACLLIVERSHLVLISDSFVTWWTVGDNREIVQRTQTQHSWCVPNCSMPPVLDISTGAFYASYGQNVSRIKLIDNRLTIDRQ